MMQDQWQLLALGQAHRAQIQTNLSRCQIMGKMVLGRIKITLIFYSVFLIFLAHLLNFEFCNSSQKA